MEGLALWIASETITNCDELSGVSYGLISRQADPTDDKALVRSIEQKLAAIAGNDFRSLWIAASWGNDVPQSATITLFGSEAATVAPYANKALNELAGTSRLRGSLYPDTCTLMSWNITNDEPMLRAMLQRAIKERENFNVKQSSSSSSSVTRPAPPPGAISINEMLAQARAKLTRLAPSDAHAAIDGNESRRTTDNLQSVLVDIRPEAQRRREGEIPGALIIERNVLEWRLDPQSDARLLEPLGIAEHYDSQIIVFCSEGYTSSLAAASLLALGLHRATDIDGGFMAWKSAGLPITGGVGREV